MTSKNFSIVISFASKKVPNYRYFGKIEIRRESETKMADEDEG